MGQVFSRVIITIEINKCGGNDRDPFRLIWELSGDVFIIVLVFNINEVIRFNLLFMNGVMRSGKAEFSVIYGRARIIMRTKQAETEE